MSGYLDVQNRHNQRVIAESSEQWRTIARPQLSRRIASTKTITRNYAFLALPVRRMINGGRTGRDDSAPLRFSIHRAPYVNPFISRFSSAEQWVKIREKILSEYLQNFRKFHTKWISWRIIIRSIIISFQFCSPFSIFYIFLAFERIKSRFVLLLITNYKIKILISTQNLPIVWDTTSKKFYYEKCERRSRIGIVHGCCISLKRGRHSPWPSSPSGPSWMGNAADA